MPEHNFDIRNRRAMVSLGPLSPKRFCTYACGFCYVHADFGQYPNLTNDEIHAYLRDRRGDFDIVYVSGDTDSFASPRARRGVELLIELSDLRCDLLFTTRALIDDEGLQRLQTVREILDRDTCLLVACISISRLRSAPHIEPKPIPTPESRIDQLRRFKEAGLTTVLAMRPFLPIIPVAEYIELVERCRRHADVVLGEVWYADRAGVLERQVFQGPTPPGIEYVEHEMDFDANDKLWKVWEAKDVESQVSEYCRSAGIPFFMRSQPAIALLRSRAQSSQ